MPVDHAAQILLAANSGVPDFQIAGAIRVGSSTVYWTQLLVEPEFQPLLR